MWWQLFVNRTDVYATQEIVNGVSQYFPKYQPLFPELFELHLQGRLTLGLPALDENGLSRWCCFDSDKDDGALERIEAWLSANHWRCHRESQRPGRAGHLWLFLEKPIPASDLRLFANRVATLVGVSVKNRGGLEIFPKQDFPNWDYTNGRYKAASVVRLPLGVNRKPDAHGARGWFAGVEQSLLAQIFWLECLELNPVKPILDAAPELRLIEQRRFVKRSSSERLIPPTFEETRKVLDALDDIESDNYDVWCQVGMGLKSGGFDLSMWEKWSAQSSKYKRGLCATKWSSFQGNGIGIGTIFYLAGR